MLHIASQIYFRLYSVKKLHKVSGFKFACCDSFKVFSIGLMRITLGMNKLVSTVCNITCMISTFKYKYVINV